MGLRPNISTAHLANTSNFKQDGRVSSVNVIFYPDKFPDNTLKAFAEFVEDFELRYDANFPDPPKVSLDSALERWKMINVDKKPSLEEFDNIVEEWKSHDRVAKFLGLYSSRRLVSDWKAACPNERDRKKAGWSAFVKYMSDFYKPTENLTLKNYQFRSLAQEKSESFTAFCNRVEKEAKHCQFKCASTDCTAEMTAICNQVVIRCSSDNICIEALKKSWEFNDLRKEGMRIESAAKGASEITGDVINKLGKYSFKNTKKTAQASAKKVKCFRCGIACDRKDIPVHAKQCPAKSSTCTNCKKAGHYAEVCRSAKSVQEVSVENSEDDESSIYNVNIFRIQRQDRISDSAEEDFKVKLIINNHLDSVLADTGAKVSVCGVKQARKWKLLPRMTKTSVKIKPYKSKVIPALGESRCSVSFGNSSVPVVWHIIDEDCEPVLAGIPSKQLGIIKFQSMPGPFMPMNMIKSEDKQGLQEILSSYPECFTGIGKLRGYQVKLHTEPNVKPVAEPPRRTLYHLEERVDNAIGHMFHDDIIEEHPSSEPAPWVSNIVIAPKDDGDIRITLDAKNVNKALKSSNFPIPRQEDIKVKLAGAKVFSKLDLKSAFWQLELAPESRAYTVFHAGGKLYRYKRLVMGLKPSQGELNAALQPLFAHIPGVHVIHDDLIIGTVTLEEHLSVVKQVLDVLSKNGLTLNALKCLFGQDEICFWGMIVSGDGVRPNPEKIEALNHITPPASKEELTSFLCMMQANSEFIPGFAKKAARLRQLTQKAVRFSWKSDHQACFEELIKAFKKETLLCYFDPNLPTFVLVDAHHTGLGAILSQGHTLESARPVAVTSRTTNKSEKQYPQLDLEGASVDFGLRRFREYLVGSPHMIKVISDHKPLVAIFNHRRKGSIRTQRIALRHQDIPYSVEYRKGAFNQADFMSRHARPLAKLPREQQAETEELNNLLYSLHSTPVIDHIGLSKIAKETSTDKTLCKIQKYIRNGQGWIPKNESLEVQRFKQILPELIITGNGIILKEDRIVLPRSLQQTAIELAHRGAHPGQSGMERRLRYHFFFHDMYKLVEKFVRECPSCSMFVKKTVKETITHHKVPEHCWETVAVDLYGPMPSSKHVVVVHDLASRYPAAKLVSSTKAEKVLPVLADIYNTFGNPEVQISDNGPPFNSAKMKKFAESRDIKLRHTPPLHPNANPAETVMKPINWQGY